MHELGSDSEKEETEAVSVPKTATDDVDMEAIKQLFTDLDANKNGLIDIEEFTTGLIKYNLHPKKTFRRPSKEVTAQKRSFVKAAPHDFNF